MGADMTLACVPACNLTPPRIERLKQLLEAIPEDDEAFKYPMEMLGYDDAERAKQRVLDSCIESQEPSRQITTIALPGLPYRVHVTGGLSWGDVPTDAFTILEHVEWCPQIWQLLEQFAREDYSAEQASVQLKHQLISRMRSLAGRRQLDVSSAGVALDYSHELPSAYEGCQSVYRARIVKVESQQLAVLADSETECEETRFDEPDLLGLPVETLEALAEAVKAAANEPT